MSMGKPIVLLTDFGYRDPYVGVMKGVIKRINPGAEIIDLTHGVRRQDVLEAAVILLVSAPYFGKGTIFVCVVDPGVGSERKALLIETRNYYLIGPDNGCLSLLAKRDGVKAVYDISNSKFRLPRISGTFHGRDLFAPIAAWLSLGIEPRVLGTQLGRNEFIKIEIPKPSLKENEIVGTIIYVDVFGNAMTNIHEALLEKLGWKIGTKLRITNQSTNEDFTCQYVKSFSHVKEGKPACYINSWGYLEIAVFMGNASETFNLNPRTPIKISTTEKEDIGEH